MRMYRMGDGLVLKKVDFNLGKCDVTVDCRMCRIKWPPGQQMTPTKA
jgi:hypothetical protein